MRFYLTLNKWVFILMASTVFLILVLAMSTRDSS
jgi:hypothetical protein